jgi:hypothetical protein
VSKRRLFIEALSVFPEAKEPRYQAEEHLAELLVECEIDEERL